MAKKKSGLMSPPPPAAAPTGPNKRQQRKLDKYASMADAGQLSHTQQAKYDKLAAKTGYEKPTSKYQGLNEAQTGLVNQGIQQDLQMGQMASGMMPQIQENLGQEFDWSQLPSAPVSGDFNKWRQEQIDQTYKDFTTRMEPQFNKQLEDFDQQMANRGIPLGSELYNKQRQQLMQQQEDTKQSVLTNAMGMAGQNASQFFDIGTTARANALGEGMQQRYMPLQEYGMLMGSQQGYGQDAMDYSQAQGLAAQQQGYAVKNAKLAKKLSGGGGGGGSNPVWAQYGFAGPQEYDQYKIGLEQQQNQWNWQNNPAYKGNKGSGVSPWAQLGGNILGSALGGWAQSGFAT